MGLFARCLVAGQPEHALIELHGSFARTGAGHGTDRALVGGLLGLAPDDERLRGSLGLAEERGLDVEFATVKLRGDVHPNTARVTVRREALERQITASSLGAGRIQVTAIDGYPVEVTGDLPRHDAYPVETGSPSVEDKPLAAGPEGVLRGSCLCGAVAFHVTEPIKVAYNCHCWRCRHARAAAHSSNGFTSFDGVRFLKGEDHLKSYKVPEARYFTQVFCDVCSSAMPQRDAERKIAFIPLGSLDDDPGIKPADHIFVAYKAGWHDITDDLPRFGEAPPG